MKLLLLGAPGSGKGTQAKLLKELLNVPHISTGDIFRENIKNETELGKQVKGILAEGKFVPDEVTIAIVKDRLSQDDCKNGYLLDGFPRTIGQAKALEEFAALDKVLLLNVDYNKIIERLSSRRTCKGCGTITNTAWLKDITKCNDCGADVVQRDDDKEAVILDRLNEYDNLTKPLIDFYTQKGILVSANGQEKVEDTFSESKKALGLN